MIEKKAVSTKSKIVIVPLGDVALLEALEDFLDNEAADKALAEPGKNIPWEKVKAELGL